MSRRCAVLLLLAGCMLGMGISGCGSGAVSNIPYNTWTKLDSAGGAPMADPMFNPVGPVVYDSESGQVLMCGLTFEGFSNTWAYEPATNGWTDLGRGRDTPPARHGHALVYDARAEKVILFGGRTSWTGRSMNDTWTYDPATNTWTELQPAGELPCAREDHAMVYDPHSGKVILFGGRVDEAFDRDAESFGFLNDTWTYDLSTNAWTELQPAGPVPSVRAYQAMAYEPDSGRVILFGGEGVGFEGNELWAYVPSTNAWTELDPTGDGPDERGGYAMAYDSRTQRMIIFGGVFGGASGTWAYDPVSNSWTELEPAGDLPPAAGHPMVYDPVLGKVFVFVGVLIEHGPGPLQTWVYTPPAP